ncbi:MAG: hypothetical protein QOF98_2439 [Streptomyces sp.]|nr:hypothetical protein [Streptomyces sp.]
MTTEGADDEPMTEPDRQVCLRGRTVALSPLDADDADLLHTWRSRPGEVEIIAWPAPGGAAADPLPALLGAYHLSTEAEKGRPVADVRALPDRYRREITHPERAFAADTVLLALTGDRAAGCLILTAATDGRSELKRLWAAPETRGQGVGAALVRTALDRAAATGAHTLALSVWQWRTPAIALYERLGFAAVPSWEERDGLLCMERHVGRRAVT